MSKLEEEVRVEKFRNGRHRLLINLIYTNNWITGLMQAGFKPFGITNQQFNILRILRGNHPEPCTIQYLKERMLDKQPDVSRLVDRLQAKGFLARRPNEEDRRKMNVIITDHGLEVLKDMEGTVNAFESLMGQLDDTEVEQLNTLLDKMRYERN